MRILHVVPTYFPAVRYGGPIQSVHGLAAALARRGHEVHVYTTNIDGDSVSDVPLGQPVELDGVSIWYFPTGFGRRLYRSPDMGRALDSKVATFDLLHIHSVFLWPTTVAARAAKRYVKPYVLAPRGMLVEDLIRRKSRFLKKWWLTVFDSTNLAHAAAVHVTSELEASEISALGLRYRRIVVIPNGLQMPTVKRRLERTQGRPTVLFLGRINWKKGLDRLLPALKFLPEAALLIAGNDEENYVPTLMALAKEAGVLERVQFIGAVQGDRKWKLLSEADVLVLPSYSENFGNVVLEAMAAGCPVVVTPEVGLAETVRQSGAGLVVSGEPQALAKGIDEILSNGRGEMMGAAGREIASSKFSWDAIASQTEELYRGLVSPEWRTVRL